MPEAAMKIRLVLLSLLFLLTAAVCSRQPAGAPAFLTGGPAVVSVSGSLPGGALPAFAREHPPGRQLPPDAPPPDAREQALVNELLKLELQLEEYRQDYNKLAARLKENQELAEKTRAELSQTQHRLARERRRLGALLNFSYRGGPVSYLGVLLGAHSFSEFVNESFYLSVFIARQAKIIRETRRLAEERQVKLARLQELQNTIEKEKELLARTITETEKLRAGRQQFLADVRRQSAELAARVQLVEEQWQKVIFGLRATMRKISTFPSGQLVPDRLTFSGGKFKAEIAAAALNRLLAAAGSDDFQNLAVNIVPEGVTIHGAVRRPTASFSLKGNFVPAPGGRKVNFSPQALEINNTPVEREILASLAGEQGISWNLGESFPFFKVLEIKPEENKLAITLAGGF